MGCQGSYTPIERKIFLFLTSLVFLVPPLLSQQAKPKIKLIKKDVEVRISPEAAAEVLKTLPLGTVIEIEETIGDWLRITITTDIGINIAGYVRRGDTEMVGTGPPPVKKTGPAPKDESDKKIFRLRDGSQIKGKITKESPDSLDIETEFGKVTLKRGQIAEIQPAPQAEEEKATPAEKAKPQAAPIDAAKPSPPKTPPAETEVRLNTAPNLIKRVPPQYPPLAFSQKIQGVVILEVRIDAQGKVKDVKVLRSLRGLDSAAVKAVEQWIYEPVVLEGKARDAVFTVTVDFKLKS
jgi:TonB family protein